MDAKPPRKLPSPEEMRTILVGEPLRAPTAKFRAKVGITVHCDFPTNLSQDEVRQRFNAYLSAIGFPEVRSSVVDVSIYPNMD